MCEDSKTVFENSKKSKFVLEQIWRKKLYVYIKYVTHPTKSPEACPH